MLKLDVIRDVVNIQLILECLNWILLTRNWFSDGTMFVKLYSLLDWILNEWS